VSLVCLLALALLAVRAQRPLPLADHRLWTVVLAACAVGLLLEPVRSTLDFGQVNLVLAVLVVADLVAPRRNFPQGILVGVAAGMKLVPALFIVYLALTGRLRAAALATAVFAGSIAAGFVVMPSAALEYWTHLFFDTTRVGRADYVGNQSIRALLARLGDGPDPSRLLWISLATFTVVAGMWIAVRLHKRERELAAVCAVALTSLLVSPISWSHHWVWALPVALVLLLDEATAGKKGWTLAAVLWLLLFGLGPIWWVPSPLDYEERYGGWRLLASNSYVVAGAAMLVALGLLASRGIPAGGREEPAGPAA
jgi:alpha-1,2-mannosyltransferase